MKLPHMPIPKLKSKRKEDDPIKQAILKAALNQMEELHQENLRLLRQGLEEIREQHPRKPKVS